ncbi:MAG: tetratricopeptide repeat protein [Acidobacteriota bacterium]
MAFKCPSCGYENRDDALMCTLCQVIFRREPPKAPAAPPAAARQRMPQPGSQTPEARPAGRTDYEAFAERQADTSSDPFLKGFGIKLDFSPASLQALDDFIDQTWGTEGEAPKSDDYEPSQGKKSIIMGFGSYLGETIRRLYKGSWQEDPQGRGPLWAIVSLPGDLHCFPISRMLRRFKNGTEDSLYGFYMGIRAKLGAPPGEAKGFVAQAEHIMSTGARSQDERTAHARRFFETAVKLDPSLAATVEGRLQELTRESSSAELEVLASIGRFGGLDCDYSLASVIALDHILDTLWGTQTSPKEPIDKEKHRGLIQGAGQYLGEVMVRHLGGRWRLSTAGEMGVQLPGGYGCSPHSIVMLRFQVGSSHDLFSQLLMTTALDARQRRRGSVPQGWIAMQQDELPRWTGEQLQEFFDYAARIAQAGHPAPADRILNYLITVAPPGLQASAHYGRSLCAMALGRYETCLEHLDRALVIVPDKVEWIENRAVALMELKRFDEALPVLDRAIGIDPGKSTLYYNRGNLLRALGRYQESAKSYSRAIELDAGFPAAWFNRALALRALGRSDEALAGIERAEQLGIGQGHPQFARGEILRDSGKPVEALKAFTEAIEKGYQDAGAAWMERARIEVLLGHQEEALQAADRVLQAPAGLGDAILAEARSIKEKVENDPARLMEKANQAAGAGRAEEAIAGYRRVLAVAPDHIEARRQLAIGLAQMGRAQEALDELDRLLTLDPDNLSVRDNRATTLARLGRIDEAIEEFGKVLLRQPDNAAAYKRRAYCFEKAGRLKEALSDYVRSTELDPTYAQGWFFRGMIEQKIGEREKAIHSLRTLVRLGASGLPRELFLHGRRMLFELENPGRTVRPDEAEPFRQRGFMLGGQGRHREALIELDRSLEIDPLSAEAWHNKGASLAALGQRADAIGCYRRAAELEPGFHLSWKSLAAELIAMERWDEALEASEQRVATEPTSAEAHEKKALCLQKLGRFDAALRSYDDAIALAPSDRRLLLSKSVCLSDAGRSDDAFELQQEAFSDPAFAEKYHQEGLALLDMLLGETPQRPAGRGAEKKPLAAPPSPIPVRPSAAVPAPPLPEAEIQKLLRQAVIRSNQKNYTGAIEVLDRLLASQPRLLPALMMRGSALTTLGRHQEAADAWRAAVEVSPDEPSLRGLAAALTESGRYQEAMPVIDRELALSPNSAHAWADRARCLLSLGRAEEAVAACESATKIDARNAMARFVKGGALEHLGRFVEARQSYQQFLSLASPLWTAQVNHTRARLIELQGKADRRPS